LTPACADLIGIRDISVCAEDEAVCAGVCVAVRDDRLHCGGCDHACAAHEVCTSSECRPAPPCGPATCLEGCCDESGECVATPTAAACGAGGAGCAPCGLNQECRAGVCACGAAAPCCDLATCADGCCGGDAVCQAGNAFPTCGLPGANCAACDDRGADNCVAADGACACGPGPDCRERGDAWCLTAECVVDLHWARWPVPPATSGTFEAGGGVVTDAVTGLVWQRTVASGQLTWQAARGYCAGLAAGGATDWRLPTRVELMTLVMHDGRSPAIDGSAFPGTPAAAFWSDTPLHCLVSGRAWFLSFDAGYSGNSQGSELNYARCVRAPDVAAPPAGDLPVVGAPPGRFVVDDETAFDRLTGLTWQRQVAPGTYSWQGAIDYCGDLALGGSADWRVPDIKELQTIVDDRTCAPAIDATVFPATPGSDDFWSVTDDSSFDANAWTLSALMGDVNGFAAQTDLHSVRCVR
jgi:hypothetical protein